MFYKKVKINIALAKESNNREYYEPTEALLTITAKDEDTCNDITETIETEMNHGVFEGFKVASFPFDGEVDENGNWSEGKPKYLKCFEIVEDLNEEQITMCDSEVLKN